MRSLAQQFHINDGNLNLRKQFLRLSEQDIRILRRLKGWAERVAGAIARDFYDHQFSFPPTRAFFAAFAQQHGVSLSQLRQRLEQAQVGYFQQIFEEATKGGQFGTTYFEQRLQIGRRHNAINLPLKWYLGSYALYRDLVRKYLRKYWFYRPRFRAQAERAIYTVFDYDLQAVVDGFFYEYLQSIGLD